MAKEVKSRDRFYYKKALVKFSDKWTVNDQLVDVLISNAIDFFTKNQIVRNKDIYSYFNVAYTIERLHVSQSFWNGDIFQSWLDMFFEAVASAVYIDAYTGTQGNEKARYKHAEALLAEYQKQFA